MGQGESASEHRVVALLDVEGTLTFRSGLEVNVKLIESLVKKNILDVYLVADSFSLVPQMRRLLEKKYKMEVHGVLTPWDISWAFMNLNEVDNLESLINKPDGYKGPLLGEEFERFVASFPFRHLPSAISSYQPQANPPGAAYQEILREMQANLARQDQIQRDFDSRCRMARAFAEHLTAKHNYSHYRGLMLDLFFQHMPDWATSVLVCSDDEKAYQCLSEFKAVSSDKPLPSFTVVRVGRAQGKRFYSKMLEGHLKSSAKVGGGGGGGEKKGSRKSRSRATGDEE